MAVRRNSPEDAAQTFQDFHGEPEHEVLELQEKLLRGGDYTALGDSPAIWLRPVSGDPNGWGKAEIQCKASVKLATDAKGKRLYFIGGEQRIDNLAQAGFDVSRNRVKLGAAYAISYDTQKVFDSFRDITYAHQFGEETGELPDLWYDQDAERLLLVGGAYSIAGVDDALRASPGIVN